MIQIKNIKVLLSEDKEVVFTNVIRKLTGNDEQYQIIKESIDARRGVVFIYTIQLDIPISRVKKNTKINYEIVEETPPKEIEKGTLPLDQPPVVVGFGPAGMFAALRLAQAGYRPLVLEQGSDVDTRTRQVEDFWQGGPLNPNSNVQFGEGGAGAFSDGKLTTRIKDPIAKEIIKLLVEFGAPDDILYSNKPHVGTDILVNVVRNIRKEIIRLGGDVQFDSILTDLEINEDKLTAIKVNQDWINTNAVILAIGHSSRNTLQLLFDKKVQMLKKPFAVGFRIEHPQIVIDKGQFKENYNHPKLKAAEYHLTHMTKNKRGCYTFCMCPGGRVIASASAPNQVVVNGMSYHARDLENANSAVLCSVFPEDFGNHILDGMLWQEKIEKEAFIMGGGDYFAPVQLLQDFIDQKETTKLGTVTPSYTPGFRFARLDKIYPQYIYDSLSEALIEMGKKLKGFDMKDAILTGVETRTSSPVRIVRDTNLESVSTGGIYPCGEGAGYAGGIVSAAVDGIKTANSIIKKYYF